MSAALILPALGACAQLERAAGADDERAQAFETFVAAQDGAHQELWLFLQEPRGSCGSQHLAQAAAGANANLALLTPARSMDPSSSPDPGVIPLAESEYGSRPVASVAKLTVDVAKAAANAGCPEQARVLYRYVIDRYDRSDYVDYRQRAEVGLAELDGP